MNETRGTVLRDSSPHARHGYTGKQVVKTGSHHYFSLIPHKTTPTSPEHVDTAPDYTAFDPQNRPFSVTARIKYPRDSSDRNVIQKGQGSPTGGMFKMKTGVRAVGDPPGIIKCLFRGSNGDSAINSYAAGRLDDSEWHTVTCKRTPTGTRMVVDGRLVATNSKDPGYIDNDWPLAIGGNTSCNGETTECNYWYGRIDYIVLRKS
jgi:hypothetical protein